MIELRLAIRFLKPNAKNSYSSSLGIVTLLGLVLGIVTLIIVSSVFLGFEEKLSSIIKTTFPHVFIESTVASTDKELEATLNKYQRQVVAYSSVLAYQGLVAYEGRVKGVSVYGVDWANFSKVVELQRFIKDDREFALKSGEIIIGEVLQQYLKVQPGSSVQFVFTTDAGESRIEKLVVKSVFKIGRYDQDMGFCYVNQGWLRDKLHGNILKAYAVKLNDPDRVQAFSQKLDEETSFQFEWSTWKEVDRNFMRSIALERYMMFLILLVLVIVAGFNIVSLLVILAKKKRRDIAILLTMGAGRSFIHRVFLIMGFLVSFSGVILAVMLTAVVTLILKKWSFIDLPADIYQLSSLPIVWDSSFVFLVCIVSISLCFLSIYIPTRSISKMSPLEGLRYE